MVLFLIAYKSPLFKNLIETHFAFGADLKKNALVHSVLFGFQSAFLACHKKNAL
jgi:hypothetical protein